MKKQQMSKNKVANTKEANAKLDEEQKETWIRLWIPLQNNDLHTEGATMQEAGMQIRQVATPQLLICCLKKMQKCKL